MLAEVSKAATTEGLLEINVVKWSDTDILTLNILDR